MYTLIQGTVMGSAETKHMTADTHSFNFIQTVFIFSSYGGVDSLGKTVTTMTQTLNSVHNKRDFRMIVF